MSKVDWSKAKKDAEYFIDGLFLKWVDGVKYEMMPNNKCWIKSDLQWGLETYKIKRYEIEMRPDNWKEGEKRMEQIAQNGNDGEVYDEAEDGKLSAYHRKVKGVWIDFYDIANAFDPENRNSADDHALKKMLLPGKRHTKGGIQDRKEAIQSIGRAIELEDDK